MVSALLIATQHSHGDNKDGDDGLNPDGQTATCWKTTEIKLKVKQSGGERMKRNKSRKKKSHSKCGNKKTKHKNITNLIACINKRKKLC